MKIKVWVFIILFSGYLYSQEEALFLKSNGYISMGAEFQGWKIENSYYPSQVAFPLTVLLPIGSRFNLIIQNTPAFSWWQEEDKLYGISDTWLQGTYVLWGEKLMLNVGIGIPTGKTRLDSAQYEFSKGAISLNVIRFKLPLYGQGLSGKAGFALALPVMENIVIGLGGQYCYKSAYHPVEYEYMYEGKGGEVIQNVWDEEYRPGDELSGQVGLDLQITEDMKIMLDGVYTHYWPDLLNNTEIYGAGDKITIHLGYFYRFGENKYLWSYFVYRHRGKNELLQGLSLQDEEKNSNGYQMELDVKLKTMNFHNGAFFILAAGRLYGKNELGFDDDLVFGGGLGVDVRVAENAVLGLQMKYMIGQLHQDRYRKLEGIDTFVNLRLDF